MATRSAMFDLPVFCPASLLRRSASAPKRHASAPALHPQRRFPAPRGVLLGTLVGALLGALSAACIAAPPALAELVGRDAALFVEAPQLDNQWTAWERSAAAQRLRQSWMWDAVAKSAALQKLQHIDDVVAAATGHRFTAQLRALCAESVAFAIYLEPHGGPRGIVLAQAAEPAAIERALKSWNQMEPAHLERRAVDGAEYVMRTVKKGSGAQVVYYATWDTTFVLSDREALVQDCLRRRRAAGGADDALAQWPPYREAQRPRNAALAAYLNPRAWDHVLRGQASGAPPERLLFATWEALRSVTATVVLTDGVAAEVALTFEPDKLPDEWSQFVLASSGRPAILERAPDDAVLVAGGRLQPAWLIERFTAALPENQRRDWRRAERVLRGLLLGRDPWKEIAPELLHDWGFVLTGADSRASQTPWRAALVAQFAVRPQAAADPSQPTTRAALQNALQFALNLLAVQENLKSSERPPEWVRQAQETLTLLRGAPVPIVTSVSDSQVVAATDPLLAAAVSAAAPSAPPPNPRLNAAAGRTFTDVALFAWVDAARLRDFGEGGRPGFTRRPGQWSPEGVAAELTHIFDAAYAAIALAPRTVRFRVGATTSAP